MTEPAKDLIKQLADRAWAYADLHSRDGDGQHGYLYTEKLAQLIVHECLVQVDAITAGCDADGEDQQALGAAWAGVAIARRFGVE